MSWWRRRKREGTYCEGCRHHLSFHYSYGVSNCGKTWCDCQHYVGPEPLLTVWVPPEQQPSRQEH